MVNSIIENLDEADMVSEIRLMLNHNKEKVCVIVEGPDDLKLFSPLLSTKSDVFQSYGSCLGVDKLVGQHFYGNDRVIGIRDRDYEEKPAGEQCFFCDYSCAEMMIISVDSCFERLYCNFCINNTMSSDEVRMHCLERLELLSKLRKLNHIYSWNVSFNGIKPSKVYSENISEMNIAIISELNRMNASNPIGKDKVSLCEKMPICSNLKEYLQITNGHDFSNIFATVASKSNGQTNSKDVERFMRGTFGPDAFKCTGLYKNLLTYQETKKLSIVPD